MSFTHRQSLAGSWMLLHFTLDRALITFDFDRACRLLGGQRPSIRGFCGLLRRGAQPGAIATPSVEPAGDSRLSPPLWLLWGGGG